MTPRSPTPISDMLARIGDKWSLLIVSTLRDGPVRFNELRRQIEDISQKMLSSTLKVLERDGLVARTVIASVPPRVEYALTDLGRELLGPVLALAEWTALNTPRILAARASTTPVRHLRQQAEETLGPCQPWDAGPREFESLSLRRTEALPLRAAFLARLSLVRYARPAKNSRHGVRVPSNWSKVEGDP